MIFVIKITKVSWPLGTENKSLEVFVMNCLYGFDLASIGLRVRVF